MKFDNTDYPQKKKHKAIDTIERILTNFRQ